MQLHRIMIVIMGILTLLLPGCREVNRYDYELIEIELMGGQFFINAIGQYGKNYANNNTEKLDFGAPYSLIVDYAVSPHLPLSRLVVQDISLLGLKTGSKHTLENAESDEVRTYSKQKLIRLSIGPLSSEEYEYQDYKLTATVRIYSTRTDFETGQVSAVLKTKFSKERRSDWIDENTSV